MPGNPFVVVARDSGRIAIRYPNVVVASVPGYRLSVVAAEFAQFETVLFDQAEGPLDLETILFRQR